jgi:hypothetical protein
VGAAVGGGGYTAVDGVVGRGAAVGGAEVGVVSTTADGWAHALNNKITIMLTIMSLLFMVFPFFYVENIT